MKARIPKGMGGGPQNMQAMLKQAQKNARGYRSKKKLNLSKKNMLLLRAAEW
ncbi:MAG: hypothetical protein ACLR5R_09940 [Eubacterium sp.]|uniref:hypothetical protein n=1 Tax=Eubacterium sp. TaxID=142586 RepID=UPI00399F0F77